MRKLFLAMMAFMLLIPELGQASVLNVGESIPVIEGIKDQRGAIKGFEDLTGKEGAIFVFFRSASWCPYCQAQLKDINRNLAKFKSKGYSVVGVSYDDVNKLSAFSDRNDINFTLLSDKNSDLIKSFGILNEDFKEGHFAYGVPHPTIFVIDRNGLIKAVYAEEGYKDRPDLSFILEKL